MSFEQLTVVQQNNILEVSLASLIHRFWFQLNDAEEIAEFALARLQD